MSRTDWQPYSLPRDNAESSRLNLQHNVYKVNTGFLLHPRIVKTLAQDARIAEIGTGTGIWLQDLAAESPASWSYTGLDISAAQFPKSSTEKSPIAFQTLNILEPIPEEYKARFDAIHLRLLICGFTGKDWDTAARHILQMLKPGGWIQWQESDFARLRVYSNAPGTSTAACNRMFQIAVKGQNKHGKILDEPQQLGRIVAGAGSEDVAQDRISSDRVAETRDAANGFQLAATTALAKHGVAQEGGAQELGCTLEEVEELDRRAREELEAGKAYFQWDMYVATGRKPLV